MKSNATSLEVRRANERGHANRGWLDSYHTFSFADYYDPKHMGFRSLRVINDDRVAPGKGFPTHPHRDMEIFSYIVNGAIAHEDSMGNRRTLRPGEIQLMSAGSGVTHSEYNPLENEELRLLQIWIEPRTLGLTPSYSELKPSEERLQASKQLVISPDGREGSARIHQDAFVYRLQLRPGASSVHELRDGRGLWLQVVNGSVEIDGLQLEAGDAGSSESAGAYTITAQREATDALLFDLG